MSSKSWWIMLATVFSLILISFMIEMGFYGLFPVAHRAKLLSVLPEGLQSFYINYVLSENGGIYRGSGTKRNLIVTLEYIDNHDYRIAYDRHKLIPYGGTYMMNKYDNLDYYEPVGAIAGNLIFSGRDAKVVRHAFDFYKDDKLSIRYLCDRFNKANVIFPGYIEIMNQRCPRDDSIKGMVFDGYHADPG